MVSEIKNNTYESLRRVNFEKSMLKKVCWKSIDITDIIIIIDDIFRPNEYYIGRKRGILLVT